MTLYILKRTVLNWYRDDVSLSAELIKSFVDGVEKQADESAINYDENKQIEVVEDQADERYDSIREVHQGLGDETWDLPTIFREYFPSLQRRSALVTLCSYFEHELDKLCRLYQSEKAFTLAPSDLGEKGIRRLVTYLEKVASLNVQRTSQEWNDINKIQTIRNDIVHRGGKLREDQDLVKWMNKVKSLSRDDGGEIVIGRGFLSYVTDTHASYFKLIRDSINANENAVDISKNRTDLLEHDTTP